MSDTFSYLAYGLSICAAMPLPELVAEDTDGEPEEDVNIRFGRVDDPPSGISEKDWGYFSSAPREDHLFWKGVGSFLVRDGRDIIVDPSPGLDERMLRLFILGPVLAVLLHQRNYLLLHASAVAVAGKAVLFLGSAGWGKSTMAATLHNRGHGLVADDVAALRIEEGWPIVFPGFPQLKLWPKTLASLGDDPEKLPRCNPRFEKRARPAVHKFSPAPLHLKRIYVLHKGDVPEILPLQPQEALGELVRHTHGTMGVGSPPHFLECVSIVNKVPVRSLRRQKSLSQLPHLARLIEEDLTRST
jgi:hypothetical protein